MSELLDLAGSVVAAGERSEGIEVYVARGHDTEIRAYGGEIESLSSASSSGVGIRVVLSAGSGGGSGGSGGGEAAAGNRVGFAWAGSLDPAVIEGALEEARDNARYATPDPDVVLAEPDGVAPAELDLWHPGFAAASTDQKVEMALAIERRVRQADPRIRQVDSADYGDGSVEVAIASTTGIRATTRRTSAYLSVSAIAGEGPDSQTGSGFTVGRAFGELDPDRAGADAVDRTVRMLGAGKARSGRCTVVFDPRVVSTLLAVVSGALSGEAVVKGRSFFADRVGETVAAPAVTLVDDPTDPRAYGAAAYDAEGLACRRNVLVEGGVLRGFVFDTVSARRAGTASTGSAVRGGFAGTPGAGCRALQLVPGHLDQAAVLAAVGDGLYVQSVTGVHSGVNVVSGDFSVGAEGLLCRGGELAEPVREVTVASTLQRMLRSVLHVGSDVEWLPGLAAGLTLAVGDMQLGGS
ncbi:MAG: TldD/PmbA family protein [Acidimicrobiales bacterium]